MVFKPYIVSSALFIASTILSCATVFVNDTTRVCVFAAAILSFGIGLVFRWIGNSKG